MELSVLPTNGMITVKELGKFLKQRPDVLKRRLEQKGIKTHKLSTHSKLQLVDLKDLLLLD